jgi:hypothetical protein
MRTREELLKRLRAGPVQIEEIQSFGLGHVAGRLVREGAARYLRPPLKPAGKATALELCYAAAIALDAERF